MVGRLLCGAVVGALALATPARAQTAAPSTQAAQAIEPHKKADLARLLQLTGAAKLGMQLFDQVLASFKNVVPGAKEAFWTEFRKEVQPEELTDRLLVLYDRHLSHAEVRELVRFYESPLGKKVLTAMPALTTESMQIGQAWAMELALRAKKKLDAQKLAQPPAGK